MVSNGSDLHPSDPKCVASWRQEEMHKSVSFALSPGLSPTLLLLALL